MKDVLREEFSQGGVKPDLVIGNPLAAVSAAIPVEVKLDGNTLLWRRDEQNIEYPMEGFLAGGPVDRAIWDFLELRDKDAEAFATFARRYGVLGLRTDGLPSTSRVPDHGGNLMPPTRLEGELRWYEEPLGAWRMYAIGLRAVMAYATELRNNPGVALDAVIRQYDLGKYTWESFDLPMGRSDGVNGASGLFVAWIGFLDPAFVLRNLSAAGPEYAQEWLSGFISRHWIEYAGLTPVVTWENGEARMTLSLGRQYGSTPFPANSLFSVLTAQMVALVTSEKFDRLDQCSVCGKIFVPEIKPGRHLRAFCEEHKLEGERERKRRWARKQAAMKKADRESQS